MYIVLIVLNAWIVIASKSMILDFYIFILTRETILAIFEKLSLLDFLHP